MHAPTPLRRLAVLVVVAFAASNLAGCIHSDATEANGPELGLEKRVFGDGSSDDGAGSGENGTGDITQPGEDPEPEPEPEPEPTPLPASWTARALDGRSGAWEALRVEARVEWTGSVPSGSTVRLDWFAPDGRHVADELDPDGANGTLAVVREFEAGVGTHEVQLNVTWTAVDGQVESRSAAITLEVLESLRIIADASTSYTSGQNVFLEDRLVPFAPAEHASAHDIIHRMGDTYGFSVETYYREDLDSWFVDAINGTAFQWAQPEVLGISYNWMLLVNGEKTQTAADDTFPELGDVVEFRYVKCYSTGQCDGV